MPILALLPTLFNYEKPRMWDQTNWSMLATKEKAVCKDTVSQSGWQVCKINLVYLGGGRVRGWCLPEYLTEHWFHWHVFHRRQSDNQFPYLKEIRNKPLNLGSGFTTVKHSSYHFQSSSLSRSPCTVFRDPSLMKLLKTSWEGGSLVTHVANMNN